MKILRIINETSNGNNKIIYESNLYFNKSFNNQTFIFNINGQLLNKMKMAKNMKRFESPIYNKMWCLNIAPNGTNTNRKDYFDVFLRMCDCPKNVSKMKVRYKIVCKEMNINTDRTKDFDINGSNGYYWADPSKKILSFTKFKNSNSKNISFELNILILELYNNNGNKINKSEWNKYIIENNKNNNKFEEKKEMNEFENAKNNPKQSNVNEFYQWLRNDQKLMQYYDIFMENDVNDWEDIKDMTKDDLKADIGIQSFGLRNKIFKKINEINNREDSKSHQNKQSPYIIHRRPKDDSSDENEETKVNNEDTKAGHDPATNLPMKAIMYKSLVNACNNNELNIAVCSADMDGMKGLNDTLGHHVTDNIIKSIADIMANHAKDNKFMTVFRMNAGGDEFGMIIKDTNNKLVVTLADDLRKEIDNSTKASISIGVAMRKNKETKNQWFKRAEDALMKAKKKGKNRVVLL